MSARTRRERRKAEALAPIDTDWLWSCPVGMSLHEIARKLNFTSELQTELSAQAWADETRFRGDLFRALNVGPCPCAATSRVIWDALDNHLCDACSNGRLIAIRDLPPDPPRAVQMVIDIVGFRRQARGFHFFHSREGSQFALVLEGWDSPTITVRSGRKSTFTIARVRNGRLTSTNQETPDAIAES